MGQSAGKLPKRHRFPATTVSVIVAATTARASTPIVTTSPAAPPTQSRQWNVSGGGIKEGYPTQLSSVDRSLSIVVLRLVPPESFLWGEGSGESEEEGRGFVAVDGRGDRRSAHPGRAEVPYHQGGMEEANRDSDPSCLITLGSLGTRKCEVSTINPTCVRQARRGVVRPSLFKVGSES